MNPVYDWLAADGTSIGCCTALELVHWQAEGVAAPDEKLGKVICYEDPSEDARRVRAWAA